ATMTHGSRGKRLGPTIVVHALPILDQLMGDVEPDVQKALAWAYRSLAAIDRAAVTAALRTHTGQAVAADDGNRAWVIRDALAKLDPADADPLRDLLRGIRRRRDAAPTSPAAAVAAAFGPMPDPSAMPEPPL
ncbi:MAG TPA: DNA alkylation repair protein, partial [Candidatus Limnocylindrales bacterium]